MTHPQTSPATVDLTCIATPTVVAQVRMMIEYRFPLWGLTGRAHADVRTSLLLIAAELVSNAVRKTPDALIRVMCVPDVRARLIRFAVWDGSDDKPEAAMPKLDLDTLDLDPERFDDNHGWGLPLVQALSENHGVAPTAPGKWIWSEIKVEG